MMHSVLVSMEGSWCILDTAKSFCLIEALKFQLGLKLYPYKKIYFISSLYRILYHTPGRLWVIYAECSVGTSHAVGGMDSGREREGVCVSEFMKRLFKGSPVFRSDLTEVSHVKKV